MESVAFKNLGAGVDSSGVRDDARSLLSLQERSLDFARPDDEMPKAIKLLNVDDHVGVPRRTRDPWTSGGAVGVRSLSRDDRWHRVHIGPSALGLLLLAFPFCPAFVGNAIPVDYVRGKYVRQLHPYRFKASIDPPVRVVTIRCS